MSTWLANKHAVALAEREHAFARAGRVSEHRQEAYDEALRTLGRAKIGLITTKEKAELLLAIHAAMARLLAFGSPAVREAAKAVETESQAFFRDARTGVAVEAWTNFYVSVDAVAQAIREDLTGQDA